MRTGVLRIDNCEGRPVINLKLRVDAMKMHLDGPFRQIECARDFAIGMARGDEFDDIHFPSRQLRQTGRR